MDRCRGAPTVGDRVDQVAGAARDVSAGPDPRIGSPHRFGVDLHASGAGALEVDTGIEKADVGALADREDDRVGGDDGFGVRLERRREPPCGVEHRRHRDGFETGHLRVADEAVRSAAVDDADAFALGLVDLLGIGRDLVGRFQRDDRHVEHARPPRGAGHVEGGRHGPPRVFVGGRAQRNRLGRVRAGRRRAQRGSGRVERDVAAADDHDPLAEVDAEALIHVEQVLDRAQHAVEIVPGEVEIAGPARTDGKEDRGVAGRADRSSSASRPTRAFVSTSMPSSTIASISRSMSDRGSRYSGMPSTIMPPSRSWAS